MKKLILLFAFISVGGSIFAQNLDVIGNINTKGKLQINGVSGTTGQVLMSNGTNPPSWTTVSSNTCAAGGKFAGRFLNLTEQQSGVGNTFDKAISAASIQEAIIIFTSMDYNTNSDVTINPTLGTFTINRTGVYHFELKAIRYFISNPNLQRATPSLIMKIGSASFILDQQTMVEVDQISSFRLFNSTINSIFDYYFTAGQVITFVAKISNINTTAASSNLGVASGGFVSGYFVSE